MTPGEHRLASLAALFAPGRGPALLARSRAGGAVEAVEHARHVGAMPRRERLQALAAALAVDPEIARTSGEVAASIERPRVALLLRALAGGAPPPFASPALLRLCRERIGR